MSGKGSEYRPVCDVWLLAPGKTGYYGSFPNGFLNRARCLLCRINEPLLHVCGGNVKKYPGYGLGRKDKTLDVNPLMRPDFLQDARDPWPFRFERGANKLGWPAILIDPPYTPEDARCYDRYSDTIDFAAILPTPHELLRRAWEVLMPGGKVGMLHQKNVKFTAPDCRIVSHITVVQGENQLDRIFKVFEKTSP